MPCNVVTHGHLHCCCNEAFPVLLVNLSEVYGIQCGVECAVKFSGAVPFCVEHDDELIDVHQINAIPRVERFRNQISRGVRLVH